MPRGVSPSGPNNRRPAPSSGGPGKRPAMPGADELFRATAKESREEVVEAPAPAESAAPVTGSGRVKHDEKITVYVTADELLALEQARLTVRAAVGRNVDRGRLVRAALAAALDDLERHGPDSDLVQRVRAATSGS